jgi:hypothetical protein
MIVIAVLPKSAHSRHCASMARRFSSRRSHSHRVVTNAMMRSDDANCRASIRNSNARAVLTPSRRMDDTNIAPIENNITDAD